MMVSTGLNIDEVDQEIIRLVQEEPTLTHTEIAKKVNRSQPTVGLRIKKLEQAGVLKFQAGINMKAADLNFAMVHVKTNKPDNIFEYVANCPFMLNAFKMSGTYNICILLAGITLHDLDEIVNVNFRQNPDVDCAEMHVITGVLNDFVLPINLNTESCKVNEQELICDQCLE